MRIDDPTISGSIEFITGARADFASASVFNIDLVEHSSTHIVPAEAITGSFNENNVLIPASALSGALGPDVELGGVSVSNATSASFASTASFASSTPIFTEVLTGDDEYTINHNLDFDYPLVQFWNSATNEQVIPDVVRTMTSNQVSASFGGIQFNGTVVIKK